MAAITIPTQPNAAVGRFPVLRVGAVATLAGAAATELFGLAARVAGIPMRAADPGAHAAKYIPVGGLFMAVVMNAALGILLAAALFRWSRRPARAFALGALVYTALSELAPFFAAHTETATKVVLVVAHVIAAAMIIPPLTARLSAGAHGREARL